MASKGEGGDEVGEVLSAMLDEGTYVATTPLFTTAYMGGSSSSPRECLDKDYISHGHPITKDGDILGASNMPDIENVVQSTIALAGEFQHARALTTVDGINPTTTGSHEVKDPNAKGAYLLHVAHLLEIGDRNVSSPLQAIVFGHDIMDPMLYPESLEFVAKELQQGSLGKKTMSQFIQFLHLLGGDLLDIAT